MSYAFNWRINIDTHHCAISGKRIYNGDQVMDVNRESLQRYGLFLSEQNNIKKALQLLNEAKRAGSMTAESVFIKLVQQ